MNLKKYWNFSEKREVDSAYIITLKGNSESERLATRCLTSCKEVGMKGVLWEAFDGTVEGVLKTPDHLKNQVYLSWLKRPNDRLSTSQLGVFYSHYSLWAHCAYIDQPIVILEHDAVMVKPFLWHDYYNSIHFLGCKEQYENTLRVQHTPPHGSIYNGNWRFICRAHAYAIDPPIARNLLSYAVREGITKTLDVFIRSDLFAIVQDDLYAYDLRGISTICEKEDYSKDC